MSPSDKILFEAFEALNKALLPDTVPPEIIAAGVKAYRENLGHLDRTVAMMWLAMWEAHQKVMPKALTPRSGKDRRVLQHCGRFDDSGTFVFQREGYESRSTRSFPEKDRRR